MKNKSARAIFIFKFIIVLGLFIATYVFFVMLGDVLGVFGPFPDPQMRQVYKSDGDFYAPLFVIDPGHGGMDSGAVGEGGVLEKDINLSLSRKIASCLEISGAKVVMTRSEDIMLTYPGAPTKKTGDVMARVKVAEDNPGCVFVSVHQNKFCQSKYSGLQVFYSDNSPESLKYAVAVQEAVKYYVSPDNGRSPKEAGSNIYVLDRIKTPAVLIECGFLSNPDELKKLCSDEYLSRLAFVIAHSLTEAYGIG